MIKTTFMIRYRAKNRGFSLLEALFATVILTIGLSSLLALFARSMLTVKLAQNDLLAKAKAEEALESIENAKTTGGIDYDNDVKNVSSGGVFVDGFQPLLLPGPDGLYGTGDDINQVELSAPAGDPGSAPLNNFQRQIVISPILLADGVTPNPDMRRITVTVQYTVGNLTRQHVVTSNISRWR
jgi:type II secretory pathway pseudopilin PulG